MPAMFTATRSLLARFAAVTSVFVLSSCTTPFSQSIDRFNEQSPQTRAAIIVSPPQIYSRETLINDRLSERKFLQDKLEETTEDGFGTNFAPTLIRDLDSITALRAAFSASFNEAAGDEYKRLEFDRDLERELDLINHEAEVAEAKLRRYEARKKLRDSRSMTPQEAAVMKAIQVQVANADGTDDDTGGGDDPDPDTADPDAGTDPDTPDGGDPDADPAAAGDDQGNDSNPATDVLAAVLSELATLRNDLSTRYAPDRDIANVRNSVPMDPIDLLADLREYRRLIREAISEVDLDDLHDHDGNSLYRMQFDATVLPGKHKDKFGVAQITLKPPKLSTEEIESLYFSWLAHLSMRLNLPDMNSIAQTCSEQNPAFSVLDGSAILDIVAFVVTPDEINPDQPKQGAAPSIKASDISLELMPARTEFTSESQKVVTEKSDSDSPNETSTNCVFYLPLPRHAIEWRAEDALFTHPKLRGFALGSIRRIVKRFGIDNVGSVSLCRNDHNENKCLPIAPRSAVYNRSLNVESFKRFRSLITDTQSESGFLTKPWPELLPDEENLPLKGKPRVHATQPTNRSQRISTTARSAKSLELALAASAALTSGASVDARAGFLKQSSGAIQTIERQPLVVGFAEQYKASEKQNEKEHAGAADEQDLCKEVEDSSALNTVREQPRFGWVFGPQIRPNPKGDRLELVHIPANHQVSADLSIPGWWPYVDATLQTAWVANWWDTGGALREQAYPVTRRVQRGKGRPKNVRGKSTLRCQRKQFEIPLPMAKADFDGLTEFLAHRSLGTIPDVVTIERIEPYTLSACQKEVHLTISGVNIWRSTRVTLAGVEVDEIEVLPDMEGVLAKVKMDKIYNSLPNSLLKSAARYQYLPLTVWTREGRDDHIIPMFGLRSIAATGMAATCAAQQNVATATVRNQFRVHNVTPASISACEINAKLYVKINRDQRVKGRAGQDPNRVDFLFNGRYVKGKLSNPKNTSDNTPIYVVDLPKAVLKTAVTAGHATLSANDGDSTSSASVTVTQCEKKKTPASPASTGTAANKVPKLKTTYISAEPVAGKLQLSVAFSHKKGKDYNNDKYRLAMLPARAAADTTPVLSERAPRPDADGTSSTATIVVDPSAGNEHAQAWVELRDLYEKTDSKAAELLLTIVEVKNLGEATQEIKVVHKLGKSVLYSKEEHRHATFRYDKGVHAVPGSTTVNIDIQLPAFAKTAYPDIEKLTLKATRKDGHKPVLVVEPAAIKVMDAGALKVQVKYKPVVLPGNAPKFPDFTLGFAQKDPPLKLEDKSPVKKAGATAAPTK